MIPSVFPGRPSLDLRGMGRRQRDEEAEGWGGGRRGSVLDVSLHLQTTTGEPGVNGYEYGIGVKPAIVVMDEHSV